MPYINYKPKLLIVDDSPEARLMLGKAAEKTALFSRVVDCSSSSAAIEALQRENFDLLVLDYELDTLNGLQVFERAKHIQDPIAGILVTAHDEKEVIIAAIQAGIRDFLEKPIQTHILANSFQRVWDELEIRKLWEAESRNHLELIEGIPDILYKIDTDGYIEYINPAVESLGVSRDELIGKHITRVIAAQDYHSHSLQTVLEDFTHHPNPENPPQLVNERRSGARRTQNLKIRLINRNEDQEAPYRAGQLMAFGQISANSLFEGGRVTGSVGVIRDITEQEKTRVELDKALEKLSESEAALKSVEAGKSRFLADMSHEVRTPLNVVRGSLDLLAAGGLDDDQRQQMEIINSSCRTLQFVIDDILDLSRMEANRLWLNPVNFQPDTLLHDVLSTVRVLPEARGLDMTPRISQESCTELNGDAERIWQILFNIVHNAVKSTEEGFVRVSMECQPVDTKGYHRLVFVVQDSGMGIAADKLEQIFASAEKGYGTDSRRYSGHGLGLGISRKLARLMRGDIQVASQEGRGSVFTFTLVLPEAGLIPETLPEPGSLTLPGPVLIVEDTMTNRLVINGLLHNMGVETDTARSGTEAVLKAEIRPYSLIFMDLQMPGMDGLEATRKIRDSRGPNAATFIVALTADVMGDVDERCRQAGMDEFLPKPVGKNEILSVFQKLAGRSAEGF